LLAGKAASYLSGAHETSNGDPYRLTVALLPSDVFMSGEHYDRVFAASNLSQAHAITFHNNYIVGFDRKLMRLQRHPVVLEHAFPSLGHDRSGAGLAHAAVSRLALWYLDDQDQVCLFV